MSTVSELAARANTDRNHMLPLWQAVERLIGQWAYRYHANGETRLYDANDLIQAGYLALHDAVTGYDAGQSEFITYLHYHIRRRFAEVSGRRGTKRRPELYAGSLDVPLDGDTDTRRMDMLADPDNAYDEVDERLFNEQAAAVILAELDKLSDQQRTALRMTAWQGHTLKDTGAVMGISPEAVRNHVRNGTRRVRAARAVRMLYRDCYRHVSVNEFRSTHTSEVEAAVLRMEEKYEQ